MTALVLYRAGRALVVILSALTLANLLELSHRLAYDTRLWAQVTSPDTRTGTSGPSAARWPWPPWPPWSP